ncbi:MAG: FAD-dependent oxidoreductase [Eubacteriaceae bacterium]|nr:FAD-dependent oxidoreductase [Eubacteriaceae bacterium]
MKNQFPNLTSPLDIGSIRIRNRFCVAPMALGHAYDADGVLNDVGIEYYVEKAKGGFGLIVMGAILTDSEIDPGGLASPLSKPSEYIRKSATLLERAHAYGSKIFPQITMGLGRNSPGSYAPSEIPSYFVPSMNAPALTNEQVKKKIQFMIDGALIVKAAGYDGIEVHAMHWGYLLDQFAMAITNKREDEYGGTLENRMRAAKEIVEGIKSACGADFPVSMRLGMKSYMKGFNQPSLFGDEEAGRTLEEGVKIAQMLESFGYDVLDIDAGVYDSFYYAAPPMYMPRGFMLELSKAAKDAVEIPVITGGGRLDDPYLIERAIAESVMDAVALGRPSLADPHFPRKVEAGKPETIRPCLACNQGCIAALLNGKDGSCAVNPTAGKELIYSIAKAPKPKKIAIAGGGVAGMEAARTAALRGHEVTLYEKSDKLGGHLISGSMHSFKAELKTLNEWYQNELKELGVRVFTNTCLNAESIKRMDIDAVVLAVGSKPIMPPIDGINSDKAMSSIDALMGNKPIGQKVVIAGGGLVGCELALDLAEQGKQVCIVEALGDILSSGEPLAIMNRMMLADLLEHNNVQIRTGCRIEGINSNGAVISQKDAAAEEIAADTVIIAIGFEPVESMARELYGSGFGVYEVGDGRNVANIMRAIWEAYEVARSI